MSFKNRAEAGKLLGQALQRWHLSDAVVYALPRGGVVTAIEIAKELNAPLDIIFVRKIGNPYELEYTIAAVAEDCELASEAAGAAVVSRQWLREEIERVRHEIQRRRTSYRFRRLPVSPEGKTVVLADDGVATGLTMRAGIIALKRRNPSRIFTAAPMAAHSAAAAIESESDGFIALEITHDEEFPGTIGCFYDEFPVVTDEEVCGLLKEYEELYERRNSFVASLHAHAR